MVLLASHQVPITIRLPVVVWNERFPNTSILTDSVNQTQIVMPSPVSKLLCHVPPSTCIHYPYCEPENFHKCLSVYLSLTILTQRTTGYFSTQDYGSSDDWREIFMKQSLNKYDKLTCVICVHKALH